MAPTQEPTTDAGPVVALVTCGAGDADRIATALVEARLAACVNIVPTVSSVYEWNGGIERDDESLLVVKTTEARIGEIDRLLGDIHPYDVFELITMAITGGNADYLTWLTAAASPRPAD